MQRLLCEYALINGEWRRRVAIDIAPDGSIAAVEPMVADQPGERLDGYVLPGMVDLHSHAFQRAMAGLAQKRVAARDDFWSWRRLMYRLVASLGPEELWAIAAALYVELLKQGYTTVVEFHYLHNAPDGSAYDDPALLSVALHEAALEAGIALTLLPTVYVAGGFGGRPLEGAQRRFALDPARLSRLLGRLAALFGDDADRRLGMALHSLRAVPPDLIGEALSAVDGFDPHAPVHIHLAEQPREVEDCLAAFGRRPFTLLAEHAEIGPRWCLVHATHLDDSERRAMALSEAVAGLCPSTEADLGDGLFDLAGHLAAGGRFGIGSDANLWTDPAAELRLLEYGQRLRHLRRLVSAGEAMPHCGRALWQAALNGGAQAAGRAVGRIAPGFRADLVHLDADHPLLAGATPDEVVDIWLFAAGTRPFVRDVMVGGLWRVRGFEHAAENRAFEGLRQVRARLLRELG